MSRGADSIDAILRRTHGPRVLAPAHAEAPAMVRLDFNERLFQRNYRDPVLVVRAAAAGPKADMAAAAGRFDLIGHDLAAAALNDLAAAGAEPLLFQYRAPGIGEDELAPFLHGIAAACERCACALFAAGGESDPDPGPPRPTGFAVGVVELRRATDPLRLAPGDLLIGLASDGPHADGYTLIPEATERLSDAATEGHPLPEGGGRGVGSRSQPPPPAHPSRPLPAPAPSLRHCVTPSHTLAPTRLYAPAVLRALRSYRVKKVVPGMVHVSGAGLAPCIDRLLRPGLDALIDLCAWEEPPWLQSLRASGAVPEAEISGTFNLGIGFVIAARPAFAPALAARLARLGERPSLIGRVERGDGLVRETATAAPARNRRSPGTAPRRRPKRGV